MSTPQRDLASVDYFFDPEILQDPYPYYDHARAQGPVAPGMPYDAIAITGYEEAVAVFNDPFRMYRDLLADVARPAIDEIFASGQ